MKANIATMVDQDKKVRNAAYYQCTLIALNTETSVQWILIL